MVEYLTNELGATERAIMGAHLDVCDDCARECASLGATIERLDVAALDMPSPPERLATKALARAQAAERDSGTGRYAGTWFGRPALAAVAVAAVFTLFFGRQAIAPKANPAPAQPKAEIMMQEDGAREGAGQSGSDGASASIGLGKATDWIAVFTGTPQEAEGATAKLTESGVQSKSRFLAADGTAVVTVASQDFERAAEILKVEP
jgi:anti-sigma factor RsiW